MSGLLQDVLYSTRQIRRNLGFSLFAVLVAGLGIGATTAMFSVIHAVLLEPLPYGDRDQIVLLSKSVTPLRFEEMKIASRSYAALAAFAGRIEQMALSGGETAEVLNRAPVSANFLHISYLVALRTKEFGIRKALGADRANIFCLVLRRGVAVSVAGIALGLCAGFVWTRYLKDLLFQVSPTDAATFAGISALVIPVVMLASFAPARRAASIDPMTALRYE